MPVKKYITFFFVLLLSKSLTMNFQVFFFKAHIFAGQVQLRGIKDFAWLTKEEIEQRVAKDYWIGTKDMLSDS